MLPLAPRQLHPPDLPERRRANHLLAIGGDAADAFFDDSRPPARHRFAIFEPMGSNPLPQDVQVVDLPQSVLQVLQILAPALMPLGQKILGGIAEALDANAQGMPRHLTAIAQRPP